MYGFETRSGPSLHPQRGFLQLGIVLAVGLGFGLSWAPVGCYQYITGERQYEIRWHYSGQDATSFTVFLVYTNDSGCSPREECSVLQEGGIGSGEVRTALWTNTDEEPFRVAAQASNQQGEVVAVSGFIPLGTNQHISVDLYEGTGLACDIFR